jgi:hypothetical protein
VILAAAAGVAAIFYLRKRRHLARGANPLSNNRFERQAPSWVGFTLLET